MNARRRTARRNGPVWLTLLLLGCAEDPGPVASGNEHLPVLRLENAHLWLEADARYGGSLSGLGLAGGRNLVNAHDPGRLVQATLYDGRFHYPHWDPGADHWPWNPVPGGDRRGVTTGVEEWEEGSAFLRLVSRPREWNGSGISDVLHEVEVSLDGPAVRYRWRFVNLSDEWREGRKQELPAVYTVRGLNRVVGYVGRRPWQGEAPTESPLVEGDHIFQEAWGALVDADGNGLTVWSPRGDARFRTFVQGAGASMDPSANATGYITVLGLADLPPGGVQEGEVYLIPGSWRDARAWIEGRRSPLPTGWTPGAGQPAPWAFHGLRTGGPGLPPPLAEGQPGLRLPFEGRTARTYPPPTGWPMEERDSLLVRASFHGDSVPVSVRYWRHDGADWYDGCEARIPARFDGEMREYRVALHTASCYQNAWVRQLAVLLEATEGEEGYMDLEELRLLRED